MISKRGRLLAAGGVALVATLGLAPTDSSAQERVRWKMQSAFPGNLSHLGTSARRLEAMVERVSGGNFELKFFEPGALVPALECFDAASKGSVESCFTTAGYHTGKHPSLAFFTAVPFGPGFGEYFAWMIYGGGKDLQNEIYAKSDLYSLDCNMIGPETSGWFKNQVESTRPAQGPEDALLRPRRPGHAEDGGVDPAARRRRHLPGAGARRDRRHRVLDAQHGHRPRLLSGRQVQLLSRLASAVVDRRAADEQNRLGGARRPEQGDSAKRRAAGTSTSTTPRPRRRTPRR